MRVTPVGVPSDVGPDTSVTFARLRRRPVQRESHLARAVVGDRAYRIDRFDRRARRQQRACRRAASAAPKRAAPPDFFGSSMRPSPISPQACRRFPDRGSRRRRRGAARHCAAWPRCSTSAGSSPARSAAGSRGRDKRRQKIVGMAVRQLGDEIRRRRRATIASAWRDSSMSHRVAAPDSHRPTAPGSPTAPAGHRCDELRGGIRHHDVDGDPFLDQQPRQLRGLVGGYAAGQAEHDA